MDERKEISTDKALQRMRPINLEEVGKFAVLNNIEAIDEQ